MCLRFKFCTHQRVCALNFLKKVKFVVPYCSGQKAMMTKHKDSSGIA
jgi:hypothetical protein